MVKLTPQPHYPTGKDAGSAWSVRWLDLMVSLGVLEENSLVPVGIRALGCPNLSLVTTPTTISILYSVVQRIKYSLFTVASPLESQIWINLFWVYFTVRSLAMRRLTTGIRSEKCVVKRFRHCANVIECTYTNLDSIAFYTRSLYIAYCS
jgi:hypothetical protein